MTFNDWNNKKKHVEIFAAELPSSNTYMTAIFPNFEGWISKFSNFLTFSISPFSSSHRKCSIKKAVLKVLKIHRKIPMLESLFNKVQGWRDATLLNGDSNTGVFLWIFLFTNNYRIAYVFPSVMKVLVKMITKEKM